MPEPIQNATQTTWGWLVIIYLFLAGVGAGAYLTSWWAAGRGFRGALPVVGRYLAAPLVGAGSLLLVFDLGAGSFDVRIFGLYTEPSSMMSLGTWILTIFLVLSVVDGYGPLAGIRRLGWVGDLAALFAAFVAIYTGLLLGVVKAIPFWHNALLPVLFLLSALSTGIAATVLGALAVERRIGGDAETLSGLHQAVLVAEGVVLALFLFFAASGGASGRFSYHRVVDGHAAVAFWLGLVVLGLAAPLVYALLGRTRLLGRFLHAPGLVAAESVLVLAGGLVLRYVVVSSGAIGPILG